MGGTKKGKDVAQAVIEVAWTTLNQQADTELKNLLATEQLEHQQLGERFLVYKKIVEEQLKTGVQNQNLVDTTDRSDLASETCESSCMEIISTTSDHDMCDRLQEKLASPEFLEQLTTQDNPPLSKVIPTTAEIVHGVGSVHNRTTYFRRLYGMRSVKTLNFHHIFSLVMEEKLVAEGAWLLLPDNTLLPKEEQDGLGTSEGYVVITDEDIIDGVAAFVAKLLSTIPQSKNMTPEDLQQGITTTFSELQKAGKLRRLWNCVHMFHKTASWGSTALELYRNPIILRAAGIAVYTSCSIILSLFP